jgi:hypothetical protein
MIGQCSEQTITRGRGSLRGRIANRGWRRFVVAASIAWMPALAGCSSSASNDYSTAASAYPSQSLADLFRGSRSSPPLAQAVASPPPQAVSSPAPPPSAQAVASPPRTMPSPQPAGAWTATAGTPLAGVSPPGVKFAWAPAPPLASAASAPVNAAMVNAPAGRPSGTSAPASSAPPDDYDAAADAYPSVALFDYLRRDAAPSANPPALSNSATQAANPAVSGQPASAGQPVAAAPGATAPAAPSSAASASSGDYDAAASAYPSVSLHDLIFGPRSSTN